MRLLQICSFYPSYIDSFRSANPSVSALRYQDQTIAIIADGFGAQHLFSAHMHKVGYQSQLIVANDFALQSQWAKENGIVPTANWETEIVRAQVEAFRPDVLYLNNPLSFGSDFIRSLSYQPALVIAWAVFAPPAGTDYSAIDLILTSNYASARENLDAGAKYIENFLPGMPEQLLAHLPKNKKEYDLVFCGQVSSSHQRRLQYLKLIAQSAIRTGRFKPAFFIETTPETPDEIRMFAQTPRWGIQMLERIALGKIGFHLTVDSAGSAAGAMRLFETTFVGTLFLGEQDPSLSTYFQADKEIATFKGERDLEEKILYYLDNQTKLEQISKAGQERCLREHGMSSRIRQLDQIIKYYIKTSGRSVGSQVTTQSPSAKATPENCNSVATPSATQPCREQTAITPEATEPSVESIYPNVSFGSLVQIIGVMNTSIGPGSAIADNCWLNVCIRDDKIRMRIGKGVLVGRGSVLSTAGYFELGDYCLLAPSVYIADSDHRYQDVETPVLMQGVTTDRQIIVEENCWLGIHSVISGSLTVGRGSVIGANSVVTRDVPPFSVVAGNPGRIVKMYNPRTKQWERCTEPGAMEKIIEDRRQFGLPTREEYLDTLSRKAGDFYIDPITVGRGVWM